LQTGLISEARNARPLSMMDDSSRTRSLTMDAEKRLSLSINIAPLRLFDDEKAGEERSEVQSPGRTSSFTGYELDRARSFDPGSGAGYVPPPVVRAERPTGVFASGAVYAGRALAEWSMVVSECNSFVDRRRDEGILGLNDVEVPTLSVEGLGMRARG
jgi:hypothetical protein